MKMCSKLCKECPFSKQALKGWLGPHTVDEIHKMMSDEYPFTCHLARDSDTTLINVKKGQYPICRGFVASATKSAKLFGSDFEFGVHLKQLQSQITQQDKNQVMAIWEFKEYHSSTD